MTDTVLSHFCSFFKSSFLSPEEVAKIPQLRFIQEFSNFLINLLESVCVNTSQKSKQSVLQYWPVLLTAEQIQNFAYTTVCKKTAGLSAETASQQLCGTKPAIHIPEKNPTLLYTPGLNWLLQFTDVLLPLVQIIRFLPFSKARMFFPYNKPALRITKGNGALTPSTESLQRHKYCQTEDSEHSQEHYQI